MRVEKTKLVVEPGTGKNDGGGRLARLVCLFNSLEQQSSSQNIDPVGPLMVADPIWAT
jgi:hypothetical protein